jgi:zinc transporter, ZIP family
MAEALGWGALAASSLVIGAMLAFAHRWRGEQIGFVLAFGAGALISAVSYELVAEGIDVGGAGWTAVGLAVGAVTYYLADGAIARHFSAGRGMPGRKQGSAPGQALALGAFLDGVPEQLVLGISVASGGGMSAGLLGAVFVSNLPEAIGSSSDMEKMGTDRRTIMRLWLAVAAVCVLSTAIGYALADLASTEWRAAINGFAAGALLVLLIDSLIPEATGQAGRTAGLITTLGFAVAAGLSQVS